MIQQPYLRVLSSEMMTIMDILDDSEPAAGSPTISHISLTHVY